jgi:hypothetical protein
MTPVGCVLAGVILPVSSISHQITWGLDSVNNSDTMYLYEALSHLTVAKTLPSLIPQVKHSELCYSASPTSSTTASTPSPAFNGHCSIVLRILTLPSWPSIQPRWRRAERYFRGCGRARSDLDVLRSNADGERCRRGRGPFEAFQGYDGRAYESVFE